MGIDVAVRSEIDRLEVIVTGPPGREFDLMVPENLERFRVDEEGRVHPNEDDLLFDDLVLLSAMQAEHADLVRAIEAVTGPDGHLTFRDVLAGGLHDEGPRRQAIEMALDLERELFGVADAAREAAAEQLADLAPAQLAVALLSGQAPLTGQRLLRWPAPNTLFARDLAVAAGESLVVSHAAEPARRREMRLARIAFAHHPYFRAIDRIDIADAGPTHPPGGPAATLEGGDVQILSERVVLVGVGLRTTIEAVRRLSTALFERGFAAVLACWIPRSRGAMHIDTLFTRIDEERCLVYPPLAESPAALGVRIERIGPDGSTDAGVDLLAALAAEGIDLEPIRCGGRDPIAQAREQWSDGANAFALAPGVILTYARNERTLDELNDAGYEILDRATFVRNATLFLRQKRRVAVALTGHELSRGRGGPRCLTLPLRRARPGA